MSGRIVKTLMAVGLMSCAASSFAWNQTYDVSVGPIWNNDDAQVKCRQAVAELRRAYPGEFFRWNGNWTTVVQGQDSVCGIESSIDLYYGY